MNKKPAGDVRTIFKGALAKQVKTARDDLFPDDIIIACVISSSLPLALAPFIPYIYVVSWVQMVREKVAYVLHLHIFPGQKVTFG